MKNTYTVKEIRASAMPLKMRISFYIRPKAETKRQSVDQEKIFSTHHGSKKFKREEWWAAMHGDP